VTGTLIHCPNLGQIYADVLQRHGIVVSAQEITAVFPLVWQEFDCSVEYGSERFSSHPRGAVGWWTAFLERLCLLVGAPPPSRFAASELFDRFKRAEAWEVFPEVPAVLSSLRASGYRLAVVSNWDERLPELLTDLDLGIPFDPVVFSGRVGFEKPHPEIFARLLEEVAVGPGQVLHVGDRPIPDFEGPQAAGLAAVLVERGKSKSARAELEPGGLVNEPIADLSSLPGLLAQLQLEVDSIP